MEINSNGKEFNLSEMEEEILAALEEEILAALEEGVPVEEKLLATLLGVNRLAVRAIVQWLRIRGAVILQDESYRYYLATSKDEYDRWFAAYARPMMNNIVRMIRGMRDGAKRLPLEKEFPEFQLNEEGEG